MTNIPKIDDESRKKTQLFDQTKRVLDRLGKARTQLLNKYKENKDVFSDAFIDKKAKEKGRNIHSLFAPKCFGIHTLLSSVNLITAAVSDESFIGKKIKNNEDFRGLIQSLYIPEITDEEINTLKTISSDFISHLVDISGDAKIDTLHKLGEAFPYQVDNEDKFGKTNFDSEARLVETLSYIAEFLFYAEGRLSNEAESLLDAVNELFWEWNNALTDEFSSIGYYFNKVAMKNISESITRKTPMKQQEFYKKNLKGSIPIRQTCTLFTGVIISALSVIYNVLSTKDRALFKRSDIYEDFTNTTREAMNDRLKIAVDMVLEDVSNIFQTEENKEAYFSNDNAANLYDFAQIVNILSVGYAQDILSEERDKKKFDLFINFINLGMDYLLAKKSTLQVWNMPIYDSFRHEKIDSPEVPESDNNYQYIALFPSILRALSMFSLKYLRKDAKVKQRQKYLQKYDKWFEALIDALLGDDFKVSSDKDKNYADLWSFEKGDFELAYTAHSMDALTHYARYSMYRLLILYPDEFQKDEKEFIQIPLNEKPIYDKFKEFREIFTLILQAELSKFNLDKTGASDQLRKTEGDLKGIIVDAVSTRIFIEALLTFFKGLNLGELGGSDITIGTLQLIWQNIRKFALVEPPPDPDDIKKEVIGKHASLAEDLRKAVKDNDNCQFDHLITSRFQEKEK